MRLGFCGVGRWAQKLAAAFRACGAEIVAHDRGNKQAGMQGLESWGPLTFWRDQLADKSIDAIVAVAPPEITTEVALACADANKPVLATKPLWKHPERIGAPFWIDYWRLWSEAHRRCREAFIAGGHLGVALYGSGPFRDFPGGFDYGPHVTAAALDIAPQLRIETVKADPCERGELYHVNARQFGNQTIGLTFGNGAKHSERYIGVNDLGFMEEGDMIGGETKSSVLQKFCSAFLADVSEQFADHRLLELDRKAMALLRQIRETAT